jgi:hypothetical protein
VRSAKRRAAREAMIQMKAADDNGRVKTCTWLTTQIAVATRRRCR